ncbi:MAG TPA: N-acetylmuramoyl-L-alanine amidase [Gemmatimonadales bacterium]
MAYPRLIDTGVVPRAVSGIASRDSAFVFGSVGRGDASLTVNGIDVPVYPNGAWLAWVALPPDTLVRFEVVARTADTLDRFAFEAALPRTFVTPAGGAWVDSTSLSPRGDVWMGPHEGLRLQARAAPGSTVELWLADTVRVPFRPAATPDPVPSGERAFGTQPPARSVPRVDRYVAWHVGALGPDPGHVLSPEFPSDPADPAWAWLVVAKGVDTVRIRWPLRAGIIDPAVPVLALVDDDTAGTGTTDSVLAGRAVPYGTYHWFFPSGTRARVSGRRNDQVRLQLSRSAVAWVDDADVQPLPPGTPPIAGASGSMRLSLGPSSVTLRVPLPGRIPFRVDQESDRLILTLYGVAPDADWIHYGGTDPLVSLIAFHVTREDETVVTVDLSEPVWGYRTRWDGTDLLFEIRRPPKLDRARPFAGLLVVLDAGHPPGGATGPTGAHEADVVLAVAREAKAMLEDRGARVVLTREDAAPVSLTDRVLMPERIDAALLVSIHANALPDGVNPFVNNGTSVYYFHPHSAALARAVDRALVRNLGFRDLGFGRGDLALARPTWMPAILTEGLYMMVPEQEAVLVSVAGQRRYARGVVEGLTDFLTARARHAR